MIILNPDYDVILGRKHIAYFTEESGSFSNPDEVSLFEVEEITYKHPDAPEHATISDTQWRLIRTARKNTQEGAALMLLLNAEWNLRDIERKNVRA